MKKIYFLLLFILSIAATQANAQERSVQNKPYIDLRPLHFGVLVGTHLQDVEFLNVGPQIITNDDGTSVEKTVTCDQVRWDAGFTVGVLAEARISENFAFRLAPAMFFGTRHFMFRNLTDKKEDGANLTEQQDLKSVYISTAADLIFAAKRFNNHRPYIMAGVNPMLNLSGSSQDYLQMKRMDLFFEVGLGCDFYLPFFKLRPELKFMIGLTNALDTKHADDLQDKTMRLYTNSVSEARSKIIALTFYFE